MAREEINIRQDFEFGRPWLEGLHTLGLFLWAKGRFSRTPLHQLHAEEDYELFDKLLNEIRRQVFSLRNLLCEYNDVLEHATLKDYVDSLETILLTYKANLQNALGRIPELSEDESLERFINVASYPLDIYRGEIICDANDILSLINDLMKWTLQINKAGLFGEFSSFSFKNGVVFYDQIDLELSTGLVQDVLRLLVSNIDKVVPYGELDNNSKNAASEQLRNAKNSIDKAFKRFSVPYYIHATRNHGYKLTRNL